jgi:hypothetical protein
VRDPRCRRLAEESGHVINAHGPASDTEASRRNTMLRVKVVSRALAVIGVLAMSATVAHAGGGQGGGSPVLNAFQCYLIDGDRPQTHVLNLADQFGSRQNVQVGRARLLCTAAVGTHPTDPFFTFDPLPEGATGDHFKCYTISPLERGTNGRLRLYDPDAAVDLTDELDVDKGVNVSIPTFLCTLVQKDCVSGGSCPPPPPTEP